MPPHELARPETSDEPLARLRCPVNIRSRSAVAVSALAICAAAAGCTNPELGSETLNDTGWVGANSFEVSTVFRAALSHPATGQYADLATDPALQAELIATQISYGKNDMKRASYQVNLMPDAIKAIDVAIEGDLVTLSYEASVDMVRNKIYGVDVKSPEDLPATHFEVTLPTDPVDVFAKAGASCADDYGNYTLTEYKYYYYFAPNKTGCELPVTTGTVDVVAVYPNPIVYPEYDRLINDLGSDLKGFRAAILPNRGDNDPMSRFNAHRQAIEHETGVSADVHSSFHRYVWTKDGATIVIDLFDPTKGSFTNTFRKALGDYQIVYYNGHSNYGHQPFLSDKDAFSDEYQIITMHSCQSYAYYANQVFAGKATAQDPSGFVNGDMVATGRSSYPGDSPDVMMVLLEDLMTGLGAVINGRNDQAPSWQAIGEGMKRVAPSILYGAAGVRDNAWKPDVEPTTGCAHDVCSAGAALPASCDPCVAKMAAVDPYCVDSFWDEVCVDAVSSVCGQSCE